MITVSENQTKRYFLYSACGEHHNNFCLHDRVVDVTTVTSTFITVTSTFVEEAAKLT
jgi:hypothetical protein